MKQIRTMWSILLICLIHTTILAQTKVTPGISWTFNEASFSPAVEVGQNLTPGAHYTITSNNTPSTIEYVAGDGDKVNTLSSLPGYDKALFLGGNTEQGANAKGYFIIPFSDQANKGEGILTIVASNNGYWGALSVHTGINGNGQFQGWLGMVELPENAEVSIKFTIPAETEDLYIATNNIKYIASVTWIPSGQGSDLQTYTLSYDGNGADGGVVPAAQSGKAKYSWVAVAGNDGNLTKTGYEFDGWQDVNGNRYKKEWGSSIQMLDDVTLKAYWVQMGYTLTYSVEGTDGTLNLSGEDSSPIASGSTVSAGTQVRINATPNTGYVLDYITLDGVRTQYVNGSLFTMPAKATNLKAYFKQEGSSGGGTGTTVGDAQTSSWLSAYSNFFELTKDKEVELSFETHATNEWYHSWVIQLTTDPAHHSPWDNASFATTTARCDATSGLWNDKPSFFEVKLYNLQTRQVFTQGNIPSSFYQDLNGARVMIRLVTDGKNTYMHAKMTNQTSGNEWLYTMACYKPNGTGTLYVSASVDNCYLTNFVGRLKPVYPITVDVNPKELADAADVRITTPEGVVLPSGIPAGVGDNLVITAKEIEGYTFAGWGNSSRTDNPLRLTVVEKNEQNPNITHHFTATYSDGSAPVISTNVPDVIYLGGNGSYPFAIATNSVGVITLDKTELNGIAEVSYAASGESGAQHILTIRPLQAGEGSFTICQAADAYHSAGEEVVKLKVAKRPTSVSLSSTEYVISKAETPDLIQPTVTVTYMDDANETRTLYTIQLNKSDDFISKLKVESDDESVAICPYNEIEVKVDRGEISGVGSANIKISFNGEAKYAESEPAIFQVLVQDGVSSDKFSAKAPEVNQKDVLSANTTDLIKYTYGGWKYDGHNYTDVATNSEVTDSWSIETENTFTPIDGYTVCVNGTNGAQDEAMAAGDALYGATRFGSFQEGKPYTLPVRGAYMTFEPLANGTLSVYLLQPGAFSRYTADNGVNRKGDIIKGIFRPRSFYIVDQNGSCVSNVSASCREKTTSGLTFEASVAGVDNTSNNVAQWADFRNYLLEDEQNKIIKNGFSLFRDLLAPVQLDNGSWMIVEDGIVKYTFHVTAGETYYVFSNLSALGFAGCNFVKDESPSMASALTLSDTETYNAPAQSTQYGSITLNRSFNANQWNTITLPFYMRPDEVEAAFGVGTQLIMMDEAIRQDDHLSLVFLYHEIQSIVAGYPYFIRPTQAVNGITVQNKLIDPVLPQQTIAQAGYTFQGVSGYSTPQNATTYESLVLKEGDLYLGASSTAPGKAVLKNSVGNTRVKGYRTYIEAPDPEHQARGFSMAFIRAAVDSDASLDDDATDIHLEEVSADASSNTAGAKGTYTLSGQRLSDDAPLARGFYILNGKKVIIANGR